MFVMRPQFQFLTQVDVPWITLFREIPEPVPTAVNPRLFASLELYLDLYALERANFPG
jgi:hypothetical protein